MDVFAWAHLDLACINLVHASHKLNVISLAGPVRRKIRRFHPDRYQVIQAEVDNLLATGFIREIKNPEWLANVVVVQKKKAENGECAWTTRISTRHAGKTVSLYPE